MIKKPTLKVVLDVRNKASADGKRPLALRVTYNRKSKFFLLSFQLTEQEWEKVQNQSVRGNLRDVKIGILEAEKKAYDILNHMAIFHFDDFKRLFYGVDASGHSVYDSFDHYIEKLRSEERFGTADSYTYSCKSLQSYRKNLLFSEITPQFLKQYQKWMEKKGRSQTTIGIYLRSLKAIYNYAICRGNASREHYPFDRHSYRIPQSRNIKKAITQQEINMIVNYQCKLPGTWEEQARDLWLFSYLCNGMNMKDILHLTYNDIQGERTLIFIRQKTKNSSTIPKPIKLYLHDKALKIIHKWGQPRRNNATLIFPHLHGIADPEEALKRVKQVVKNINKWVRYIASELQIQKDITTYTARHSFATVLKRNGASIELISESLGHSNIRTSEQYLDSFESEEREKVSRLLL